MVSALVLATIVSVAPAGASLPVLTHLRPGQAADIHPRVPVNVVFVGLEPGAGPPGIDVARLLSSQRA